MRRFLCIPLTLIFLVLMAPGVHAQESAVFVWTLTIGDEGTTTPAAMAAAPTGGVFVVGAVSGDDTTLGEPLGGDDGFVLSIGAGGSVRWALRLGGSGDDALTAVAATPDGGCVAIGTTLSEDGDARASRGGQDAWLVRVSAGGELLFSKCLGGSLDDELSFLSVTEEGEYFVCGRTQSRNEDLRANHGGWDAWAMLLGAEDGKPLWADSSYRFGEGGDDVFTQGSQTDAGWLLLGELAEEASRNDADEPVFRKRPVAQLISPDGEAVWEEPVILGDTGDNLLHAMTPTDTGWLLGGETNSRSAFMPSSHGGRDIWLLHMRQSGTASWQRSYGGSREDTLHMLLPDGDSYLLLGGTKSTDGQVFGAHGNSGDVWVVRTTSSGVMQWQQPIGGTDESTPAGMLVAADGTILVAGTTLAQDGDIGRHAPMRTGFLAWLSPNGNLLHVAHTTADEECTLTELITSRGAAYALGSVQTVKGRGTVRSAWISRLSAEGFRGE